MPLGLALALWGAFAYDHDHGAAGTFSRWELATYDWRFQWRGPRPASPEILVAYVDDESIARLRMRGSVPSRRDFARAIDNALEKSATVVGLDYVFEVADPATNEEDREFVACLDRAGGSVVLACFVARGKSWEMPAPEFRNPPDTAPPGLGMINVISDPDGIVRRPRFLGWYYDGTGQKVHVRGFALELFWLHKYIEGDLDESGGVRHVDVPAKDGTPAHRYEFPGDALVDFPGPARHFDHVPFWQLVEDKVPADRLKGRVVLVGDATTVRGGADFVQTPFWRTPPARDSDGRPVYDESSFPGVDYHAASLQSMLEQRYVYVVDVKWTLAIAATVAFALGVLGCTGRLGIMLAAGFVALVALLGGAWDQFIHHQRWLPVVMPATLILAELVLGVTVAVVSLLRQRSQVDALFGRYVSGNYVKLLLERVREGESIEGLLVGRRQDVTVIFTDVRGFTSLSEHLDPERIATILKRYFNHMTRIVREDFGGTMDKLLGDGLMAFYNAPLPQPDHALRACHTALAMVAAVDTLDLTDVALDMPLTDDTARRLRGPAPLAIGIGINTGPAIVGDLGSDTFADYTVLGDTVNLASRLEGLTKEYGARIIVGETTRAHVDQDLVCRRIDQVYVKGRTQPVWIHEVLTKREGASPDVLALARDFEAAIEARVSGDIGLARRRLEELRVRYPKDRPTAVMLDKLGPT